MNSKQIVFSLFLMLGTPVVQAMDLSEQELKSLNEAMLQEALTASTQARPAPSDARLAQQRSDAELARKLQEESDRKEAQERQRKQQLAADALVAQRLAQSERDAKAARERAEREQKQQASKPYPIKHFEIKAVPSILQKSAECGFHAIHNCAALLQLHGATQEEIERVLNDQASFKLVAMQNRVKESNMIDGLLIGQLGKEFYGLDKNSYTIMPNFRQALSNLVSKKPKQSTIQYIPPTLVPALRQLRLAQNAVHGFIIGNMSVTKIHGQLAMNHGHWFTIVAHKKNDTLTLYCADSLRDSHAAEYAQDLIELIKNAACAELEKAAR